MEPFGLLQKHELNTNAILSALAYCKYKSIANNTYIWHSNKQMSATVIFGQFEWDAGKGQENSEKHGLDFYAATLAFLDPNRIIAIDEKHSLAEERLFCIGRIGRKIATVRFTRRRKRIRIIGAGFWRSGRKVYEAERKSKRHE